MGRTIPTNYYGYQLVSGLKEARKERGLTQTEAAQRMRMTVQKISRIELGQVPNYYEMLAFLEEYDVPAEEQERFAKLHEMATVAPWWNGYGVKRADLWEIRMEGAALRKEEFQCGYVPELLQTESYARALLSSPGWLTETDRIDSLVELRMRRQEFLCEQRSMRFHAIIHDSVLENDLMSQAQLEHLIKFSQYENITIQVSSSSQKESFLALRGSFNLFFFESEGCPEGAGLEAPFGRFQVQFEKDRIRLKEVFDDLQSSAFSSRVTLEILTERQQSLTPAIESVEEIGEH